MQHVLLESTGFSVGVIVGEGVGDGVGDNVLETIVVGLEVIRVDVGLSVAGADGELVGFRVGFGVGETVVGLDGPPDRQKSGATGSFENTTAQPLFFSTQTSFPWC